MDKKQRLGLTSYYQQYMLLVTEHEKVHYQRSTHYHIANKQYYQPVAGVKREKPGIKERAV
jgi:hypothetical protein